jgi:hypothetical protein
METEKMNYEQQYDEIKNNMTQYWKPEEGLYDVEILEEAQKGYYDNLDVEKDEPIRQEQMILTISVDETKYKWTLTKGKTLKNAYSRILQLAINNNNKLKGLVLQIGVQITGKTQKGNSKRQFTIMHNGKMV